MSSEIGPRRDGKPLYTEENGDLWLIRKREDGGCPARTVRGRQLTIGWNEHIRIVEVMVRGLFTGGSQRRI